MEIIAIPAGPPAAIVIGSNPTRRASDRGEAPTTAELAALERHATDFEDEPTLSSKDYTGCTAMSDVAGCVCSNMHSLAERIAGSAQYLEMLALQSGVDRVAAAAEAPPIRRAGNPLDGL